MARFKVTAAVILFFGILAANTYFRFDIRSKPLHVLQSAIDTTMTSWMGDTLAALTLAVLGIGLSIWTLQRGYEPQAQVVLKSTKSALKGKVYKPSPAEEAAFGKGVFGKRR